MEKFLQIINFLFKFSGSEDDPQTWSVQTFMSLWWVYVFALLAVYSGGLIALLTTSHMVLPFTDLKGLAEAVKSEKYKLCVESGTVTYGAVMVKLSYYV